MIQTDYNIKVKPITSRSQQAISIQEGSHQTMNNIICAFKVQNIVPDNESPMMVS